MIEIIDNFLKQEDFDSLTFLYDENNFMINERLDWCVQKKVTIPQKTYYAAFSSCKSSLNNATRSFAF